MRLEQPVQRRSPDPRHLPTAVPPVAPDRAPGSPCSRSPSAWAPVGTAAAPPPPSGERGRIGPLCDQGVAAAPLLTPSQARRTPHIAHVVQRLVRGATHARRCWPVLLRRRFPLWRSSGVGPTAAPRLTRLLPALPVSGVCWGRKKKLPLLRGGAAGPVPTEREPAGPAHPSSPLRAVEAPPTTHAVRVGPPGGAEAEAEAALLLGLAGVPATPQAPNAIAERCVPAAAPGVWRGAIAARRARRWAAACGSPLISSKPRAWRWACPGWPGLAGLLC